MFVPSIVFYLIFTLNFNAFGYHLEENKDFVQRPHFGMYQTVADKVAKWVLPTPSTQHTAQIESGTEYDSKKSRQTADESDGPSQLHEDYAEFKDTLARISATHRQYKPYEYHETKFSRLYNKQWDRILRLSSRLVRYEIASSVKESIESLVIDYLPTVQNEVEDFLKRGKVRVDSSKRNKKHFEPYMDVIDPQIPPSKWLSFMGVSLQRLKSTMRRAYKSMMNDASAFVKLILDDAVERCTQAVVNQTAQFFYWNMDRNAPKFVYKSNSSVWTFPQGVSPLHGPALATPLQKRWFSTGATWKPRDWPSLNLSNIFSVLGDSHYWSRLCLSSRSDKLSDLDPEDMEYAQNLCDSAGNFVSDSEEYSRLQKRHYPNSFYEDMSAKINPKHTRNAFINGTVRASQWGVFRRFRRSFQILVDRLIYFNLYNGIYAELEVTSHQFLVLVRRIMPSLVGRVFDLLTPNDLYSESVQKLVELESSELDCEVKDFRLHVCRKKAASATGESLSMSPDERLYPFFIGLSNGQDVLAVFTDMLNFLDVLEDHSHDMVFKSVESQEFYTNLYSAVLSRCLEERQLNVPQANEYAGGRPDLPACRLVERADGRTARFKLDGLTRASVSTTSLSEMNDSAHLDPLEARQATALRNVMQGSCSREKQLPPLALTRGTCDPNPVRRSGSSEMWETICQATRSFLVRGHVALIKSWGHLYSSARDHFQFATMHTTTAILRQWNLVRMQLTMWTGRVHRMSIKTLTNFLCAEVKLQVQSRAGRRTLGYYYSPPVKSSPKRASRIM